MSDAHHGPAYLAHHFETPKQQFESAKLGMWIFLAQEILFFSGLFVAYGVFRNWYPESFSVGSHLLNWKMGATNTCVLLLSSFTAAMAVQTAQRGERKLTSLCLIITILCACGFMVIKYFEYAHKFHVGFLPGQWWGCPGFSCEPPAEGVEHYNEALAAFADEVSVATTTAHWSFGENLVPFHLRSFFGIYFVMTGLHGIHVMIGIGLMIWLLVKNQRGRFSADFYTPIDLTALYWHLVDLIWIFLFPLLYLID